MRNKITAWFLTYSEEVSEGAIKEYHTILNYRIIYIISSYVAFSFSWIRNISCRLQPLIKID